MEKFRIADHPRMRGEDFHGGEVHLLLHGSPPHARGRRAGTGWPVVQRRITPACAGKTTTGAATSSCARDHPRMRG